MKKDQIEKMSMDDLMSTICTISVLQYDGHFTILSFTTHYKGGFGTIIGRQDIDEMKEYHSLKELLINMIYSQL